MIEYSGLQSFEDVLYNSFTILEDSIPLPNLMKLTKILSFSCELSGNIIDINKQVIPTNTDCYNNLAKIQLKVDGILKYKSESDENIILNFNFSNYHFHYLSIPNDISKYNISKLSTNILRMFTSKKDNNRIYYSLLCQIGIDN